jgi:hypothetical protein
MTTFVVRFPDGEKVFVYPAEPLKEGYLFWHDGRQYRVLSITQTEDDRTTTVTVEPEPEGLGDMLESEQGGGFVLVPADA